MNHDSFLRSPYLESHRSDLVAWNLWSEDTLKKAREVDKPLFITIGYSTCHWCHVMQEESFRNPEISDILNREYVPVVVDREERPDVDSFYMNVSQYINGSGGWPLNVIAMPDGRPFQIFTYLPPVDSGGAGLLSILRAISEIWRNERGRIIEAVDQISPIILPSGKQAEGEIDFNYPLEMIKGMYDRKNGGFGDQPKFPNFPYILFLMSYMESKGLKTYSFMIEKTLKSIRNGGIFDQVGGGVHRYSTDSEWKIPHFEKMLYDQAMALETYTNLYRFTSDPYYLKVADEIASFVQRDMSNGSLYVSGIDADFNGEEGLFYTWEEDEFNSFTEEEREKIKRCYYFEKDSSNRIVLRRRETVPEFENEINNLLLQARKRKGFPRRDDKAILSWNAMYIYSLLSFTISAHGDREKVIDDVRTLDSSYSPGGKMYRTLRNGNPGVVALLEDYAYLSRALLFAFEISGDGDLLAKATSRIEETISLFFDTKDGGFFSAVDSEDKPVIRGKERLDLIYPSGESIMFLVLEKMYILTGDRRYRELSNSIIHSRKGEIVMNPLSSIALLSFLLSSNRLLRVELPSTRRQEFLELFSGTFMDNAVIAPGEGKIAICSDKVCILETDDPHEAVKFIKGYRN